MSLRLPLLLVSSLLLSLLASSLSPVAASEASSEVPPAIAAALKRLAPQARIESVRPGPLPGLHEVIANGSVLYLSSDGRHLIQGSILDTVSAEDLTEAARARLRRDGLAALPDASRIRFSPAAATHQVTVFTAIDCGYCRRFHGEIQNYLDAGIAVNYVLIPLGGPGSAADQASQQVHCAADRPAAFTAATLGQPLSSDAQCPSHYQDGVALAARLGISNTPTLIGPDGRLLGGYMSPKELLARLEPNP